MKSYIKVIVTLIATAGIGLLSFNPVHASVGYYTIDTRFITAPTEAMIDAINANVIRFDHASVGSNAMNGLNNISVNSKHVILEDNARGNPGAAEKVSEWKDSIIARNTDGSPADDIQIAVFKWCYIDSTDIFNSGKPDNLAGLYTAISDIREHADARVRNIKILILTVPLDSYANTNTEEDNTRIKALTSSFSNVWVYDIADFESRHGNGTQCLDGTSPIVCQEFRNGSDSHPATEEGENRVGLGLFLSLYQVASNTLTPDGAQPASLQNVYTTFGLLRYNKYVTLSRLRYGDIMYLKNYDSSKLKILQIFLYDYAKKGNQGFTKTNISSTAFRLKVTSTLPLNRRYAYVVKFQDRATGIVATKYFVFWTGSSTRPGIIK